MAHRVKGTVERMYTNYSGCNIRLKGIPAADTPENGYFLLRKEHSNYNALYSLALAAAVNRHPLDIRATDEIRPNQPAEVQYFVLDW